VSTVVVAAFLTPVRHRSAAAAVFRTAARPVILTRAVAITTVVAAATITAVMAAPITGGVTEADLPLGRLLVQLCLERLRLPPQPTTTNIPPASTTGPPIKT